jgi:hypothetical protein
MFRPLSIPQAQGSSRTRLTPRPLPMPQSRRKSWLPRWHQSHWQLRPRSRLLPRPQRLRWFRAPRLRRWCFCLDPRQRRSAAPGQPRRPACRHPRRIRSQDQLLNRRPPGSPVREFPRMRHQEPDDGSWLPGSPGRAQELVPQLGLLPANGQEPPSRLVRLALRPIRLREGVSRSQGRDRRAPSRFRSALDFGFPPQPVSSPSRGVYFHRLAGPPR